MKQLFVFLFLGISLIGFSQKRQVIVDADTGNEVDDLYALARILLEPSVNVTALNAAHWQTSHWTIENSMENSHRLNQQLLGEMGLAIKTFRGAPARMYDWGDRAQHSAAAYEILRQAKSKDNLDILVLGALTNVASAVFIAPEIATKLNVFWLGTTVDFEKKIVKRNDFNPLMDTYALDFILESDVEIHIMPVSVASAMQISFDEMESAIGNHFLGKHLQKRWVDHIDSGRRSRVLWDLALVASYINPDFAETTTFTTSRDSGNRPIAFYHKIDAMAIYDDFFKTILAFEKK